MTAAEADQHRAAGLGRLFASTAVSLVGQGAVFAAVPLLAASLTTDPVWVSLATAATYAAWLVVGLPIGALVDRWPLRPMMVGADIARGALLGVLLAATLGGVASMPLLVGVVFLIAVAGCFFDPAAQSAIPAVAGRSEAALARANGRYWSLDTFGRSLVGPPLGALLFALSHALPFGLGVGTFVVSGLFLAGLPLDSVERAGSVRGVWRSAGEGLRFLGAHRRLRLLVLAMGAFNFGYNLAFGTLVLFALERLNLSPTGYGFLIAAPAAGGVVSGFFAQRLQAKLSAPAAYVLCLAAQGLAWAGIAGSQAVAVAFVFMVVVGVASNVVTVLGGTARQLLTPAAYLGRVSAATRVIGLGAGAVGAGAGGVIAQAFGVAAPLWAATAWLALMACAFVPGALQWRTDATA